jgi:hypothetical protein
MLSVTGIEEGKIGQLRKKGEVCGPCGQLSSVFSFMN